jgi:hypothetical protein
LPQTACGDETDTLLPARRGIGRRTHTATSTRSRDHSPATAWARRSCGQRNRGEISRRAAIAKRGESPLPVFHAERAEVARSDAEGEGRHQLRCLERRRHFPVRKS